MRFSTLFGIGLSAGLSYFGGFMFAQAAENAASPKPAIVSGSAAQPTTEKPIVACSGQSDFFFAQLPAGAPGNPTGNPTAVPIYVGGGSHGIGVGVAVGQGAGSGTVTAPAVPQVAPFYPPTAPLGIGAAGQFPVPPGALPESRERVIVTMPGGAGGMPNIGPGGPGSPMMLFWSGKHQGDPEMEKLMQIDFKLDHESHELAEEYRIADKDKKDEIKKNLADTVNKQFEARQKRRALEVERLDAEIKKIRASIEKRTAAKQQIVDRRIAELLGQDDTSF
jgi:hypothetical protein